MKYIALIFIFISSLWSLDLDWEHDLNKALEQAKVQNKSVYFFIGADRCRWCDRFYKMTLSDKKVMERLEKEYVLLYMNRDQHEVPDNFEKYQVPRHYFLDSNGKILYKTRGSREIAGFNALLDEVELEID